MRWKEPKAGLLRAGIAWAPVSFKGHTYWLESFVWKWEPYTYSDGGHWVPAGPLASTEADGRDTVGDLLGLATCLLCIATVASGFVAVALIFASVCAGYLGVVIGWLL